MSTKRIKLATGICLVAERDPIHTAKTGCDPRLPEWRTLFLFSIGGGWNAERRWLRMPQGRNYDALAVCPAIGRWWRRPAAILIACQ